MATPEISIDSLPALTGASDRQVALATDCRRSLLQMRTIARAFLAEHPDGSAQALIADDSGSYTRTFDIEEYELARVNGDAGVDWTNTAARYWIDLGQQGTTDWDAWQDARVAQGEYAAVTGAQAIIRDWYFVLGRAQGVR